MQVSMTESESYPEGCPPSANWYCSQILASEGGRVVLGARQDVVVLDVLASPQRPRIRVLKCCPDKVKVLAVDVSQDRVAASAEDGTVYWWSMDYSETRLRKVRGHRDHRELTPEKCKVQCLDWSRIDPGVLASGDESGHVLIWDTRVNGRRSILVGKHNLAVLKWNLHLKDHLVIGCRFGLVLVVNVLGSGQVQQKIRAHDEDIQSLAWCPTVGNPFAEVRAEASADTLFVVGSRDRKMSVWSSQTGQQKASLGLKPVKGPAKGTFWLTCLWPQTDKIVSSGSQGEILEWSLPHLKPDSHGLVRSDEVGAMAQVLHREHHRMAFSLSWAGPGWPLVSVGQDRQVIAYNLEASQLQFILPTFGSWVESMASNPVDSSLIAIGGGDGLIRLWRSLSTKATFDVTTIAQKNNSGKITALAWHPDYENLLAFGTDEGRMGTIDTLKVRNPPTFMAYKHRGQVYNLLWGPRAASKTETEPPEDTRKARAVLYSCGDGKIIIHDTQAAQNPSIDLESIIEDVNGLKRKVPNRSEMAFHHDAGRFMALGLDDGSVEVLAMPEAKILCTIKVHLKLIQSLKFHPQYCHDSEEVSAMANVLAMASNESVIHLVDIDVEQLKAEVKPPILTKPTYSLHGHHFRVIQVDWSQHHEGRLASISYDGSAQIWDVKTQTGLANFGRHEARLFSLLWSPTDPDVVLTGGEDCTLFIWKISEQSRANPLKKSDKAKLKVDFEAKEGESEERREIKVVSAEKKAGKKAKPTKLIHFPLGMSDENKNRTNAGQDSLDIIHKRLVQPLRPSLAFFGGDADIEAMLGDEAKALLAEENIQGFSDLHLWSGNYASCIREVMEQGKLTDWHISMASACDQKLWREACETYARQLVNEEAFVKASSYLLMVNKLAEAIDTLAKGHFYREAITLAKLRLPEDHPKIQELLRDWAQRSHFNGAFDLSARAWAAASEPLKCSTSLAKIQDPDTLRAAALLAQEGGEEEKAQILACQGHRLAQDVSNEACRKKIEGDFPGVIEIPNGTAKI